MDKSKVYLDKVSKYILEDTVFDYHSEVRDTIIIGLPFLGHILNYSRTWIQQHSRCYEVLDGDINKYHFEFVVYCSNHYGLSYNVSTFYSIDRLFDEYKKIIIKKIIYG